MIAPNMQHYGDRLGASVRAASGVTALCGWSQGTPLSGTVNGVAAATDSTSAGAIYTADLVTPNPKVIIVPEQCAFMEVSAFGDGNSITVAPVVEFYATHGTPDPANKRWASVDYWTKLYNVLGQVSVTFDGAINDVTGVAGVGRYNIEENTYQRTLLDLRGARIVVSRVLTTGSSNNWWMGVRFLSST